MYDLGKNKIIYDPITNINNENIKLCNKFNNKTNLKSFANKNNENYYLDNSKSDSFITRFLKNNNLITSLLNIKIGPKLIAGLASITAFCNNQIETRFSLDTKNSAVKLNINELINKNSSLSRIRPSNTGFFNNQIKSSKSLVHDYSDIKFDSNKLINNNGFES